MTQITPEFWRRCSSCKNPIAYIKSHFVCSVSTCTRKRTGYVFCTVHCWERHLPGARHRDAAAIEAKSPSYEQWKKELEEAGELSGEVSTDRSTKTSLSTNQHHPHGSTLAANAERSPQRVIARQPSSASSLSPAPPKEILVVASKLKAYIRARSEMNTSDSVMDALSDEIRQLCDDAIEKARIAGRKTVMDRDFE